MKTSDSLFKFGDRSSVKISIDLKDLSIKGINLCLISSLLSLPGIDGRFDVFSLGFKGMGISLELSLVFIYRVDLVVDCYIVGIEKINLAGESGNIGIVNKDSSF